MSGKAAPMTSTIETPITIPAVGPCPSWCEKPSGHEWEDQNIRSTDDTGRSHDRKVGEFVEIYATEVAGEPTDGPALNVEVFGLDTREEATEVVDDIQTAINLAFPRHPGLDAHEAAEFERRSAIHAAVLANGASPCPVPWCDQSGSHLYDDETEPTRLSPWGEHSRECRHETGQATNAEVGAVFTEGSDGCVMLAPVVEIGHPSSSFELTTPDEVEAYAAAIRRAAGVAFRADEQFRAHRDAVLEFDAAVAECIARAGTAGNRAAAALIRLRNAQDALDATR